MPTRCAYLSFSPDGEWGPGWYNSISCPFGAGKGERCAERHHKGRSLWFLTWILENSMDISGQYGWHPNQRTPMESGSHFQRCNGSEVMIPRWYSKLPVPLFGTYFPLNLCLLCVSHPDSANYKESIFKKHPQVTNPKTVNRSKKKQHWRNVSWNCCQFQDGFSVDQKMHRKIAECWSNSEHQKFWMWLFGVEIVLKYSQQMSIDPNRIIFANDVQKL